MKRKLVSNHYIQACLHGPLLADIDPMPLLERAAVPAELIHQPHARITEVQLANLIKAVWRSTGDEFMGLTARPCKNGVFALMMESLFQFKTLGAMLQQSIRFYTAVQDEIEFSICHDGDLVDISATLKQPQYDPDHLLQEFILLMWQRLSCWLVNTQVPVHSTRFNFPPPDHVDEYSSMYGDHLLFDQPTAGFTFSSKLLTLPLARDPIEMELFLRQSPLEVLRRVGSDHSLSTQVRRQILKQGLEQPPTLEEIANQLHMTSRTLRRKLKDESASFQQIKDQVRCDMAIRLLTEESLSVAETSQLVGFTEQAAFCRAFKNWTGVSPSLYMSNQATQ
ncbi:MAG: AraC family transcriptional regulator [Oceanospirillaceae bacterium]|nr:AraC family transcriptional regulator [Oceanospirillaceae bacterium]